MEKYSFKKLAVIFVFLLSVYTGYTITKDVITKEKQNHESTSTK
ncbi:hypothetical protein [Flavobacterium cerinum]|uniref:Uncharacterized protein n=1 Tax=Flavobacterium cerinum TaxID=2502784 RepID=A0ABY5IUY9_9FLAO|nr:hypothetical protein [Flavobacterium cerinum]UUC46196.1 hypothetical protein NOX80_03080 [Flavobacterium cerinum]